jgi:uncharacterized LabA/DUF88 family protein
MDKCAIFIDGGYLNKILKNSFNKADVDYLKLSEHISKELGLYRLRTYYYHCMPLVRKDNEGDEERLAKIQKFLTKLRRLPRFEVKLGRLQIISGKFKQKMVDVLMSLDIVEMCFNKNIQHAVLIAGDSDFVPAIKKAKDYGSIVHLYHHPESVHTQLLDEADERHPITERLISGILIKK